MDKLDAELQRLHYQPAASPEADHQPVLSIAFPRAADWSWVATVWCATQEELELPPPAVSVDGEGYRLWFSLAEPVSTRLAQRFCALLCSRFSANVEPPGHAGAALKPPPATPAVLPDGERWSAFIDPGLGSMFMTEPWLEMAPNRDRQADLLGGLRSMTTAEFEQAMARLDAERPIDEPQKPDSACSPATDASFADPREFLLAVMNDHRIATHLRIEAAQALLPYFSKPL